MTKAWRKSSFSGDTGGNCVEVRETDTGFDVRDSKNPTGPVLHFSDDEWTAFIQGAKTGEFDLT